MYPDFFSLIEIVWFWTNGTSSFDLFGLKADIGVCVVKLQSVSILQGLKYCFLLSMASSIVLSFESIHRFVRLVVKCSRLTSTVVQDADCVDSRRCEVASFRCPTNALHRSSIIAVKNPNTSHVCTLYQSSDLLHNALGSGLCSKICGNTLVVEPDM
jgi:hypothetical protein